MYVIQEVSAFLRQQQFFYCGLNKRPNKNANITGKTCYVGTCWIKLRHSQYWYVDIIYNLFSLQIIAAFKQCLHQMQILITSVPKHCADQRLTCCTICDDFCCIQLSQYRGDIVLNLDKEGDREGRRFLGFFMNSLQPSSTLSFRIYTSDKR